jgi:hypothetical protein
MLSGPAVAGSCVVKQLTCANVSGRVGQGVRRRARDYEPEPDTVAETRTASTTMTTVIPFSRVGVSHAKLWAPSQERRPLTAPAAVAAVAMH